MASPPSTWCVSFVVPSTSIVDTAQQVEVTTCTSPFQVLHILVCMPSPLSVRPHIMTQIWHVATCTHCAIHTYNKLYRLEHLATKSEPCVLEVGGTLPHLPHTKRHTSVVLSAAPGGQAWRHRYRLAVGVRWKHQTRLGVND